eukprot:Skav202104  [mRNA]  locus=scaffold1980:57278:62592:+ [translate_table: standard]
MESTGTLSTRLGSLELCPLPIGGHHYPPLDTEAMLEDAEVVKLVHRVAVFLGSAEAGGVMEGARAGDLGRALQRAKQAGEFREGHKGLQENVVRLLIQQALDALVAYECLCGHRPFGDSQFVVEYESRHEPRPVDMKAIVDIGVSQAAVKFISWLLEKQEAWRPSSEEAGAQKDMNWPEVAQPDGYADYSEFIAGCLDAHTDLIESALSHVFHVFDVNGDGKISLKELSSILTSDGSLSIVLPEGKTVEEFMKEFMKFQPWTNGVLK